MLPLGLIGRALGLFLTPGGLVAMVLVASHGYAWKRGEQHARAETARAVRAANIRIALATAAAQRQIAASRLRLDADLAAARAALPPPLPPQCPQLPAEFVRRLNRLKD